ncbi:rhodanese-like domain-containing protein [Fluviibacterium sp. DFM31]|uniref:Rhodanese-like domain-containing protein n=1 Tax=Meridianimarinicoccus marinus TaxID=3231483 RepID=A0ABV3L979_9RHOB
MTSCSDTGSVTTSSATPISAATARTYHGRAGVEFVDPRPPEAIYSTTGKIPGARLISISDVERGNLPPAFADRSLHIVATCQAGPMASKTAAAFAKLGFARVSWVEGGTQAWVDAGYETLR